MQDNDRVEELLEEISEKLDEILEAMDTPEKPTSIPVTYPHASHESITVTNYLCPVCGGIVCAEIPHSCQGGTAK